QDLDEESGQEPNACVDRAEEYRLREVRLLGLQVMRDPAPPWDLRASHDTVGGLEEKDRLRHPQLLELRAREDLASHSRIHDPDAIRRDPFDDDVVEQPAVTHDVRDHGQGDAGQILVAAGRPLRLEPDLGCTLCQLVHGRPAPVGADQRADLREARIPTPVPQYAQETGGTAIHLSVLANHGGPPPTSTERDAPHGVTPDSGEREESGCGSRAVRRKKMSSKLSPASRPSWSRSSASVPVKIRRPLERIEITSAIC